MAKFKTYKNVKQFTEEGLSLNSYESWLITTKNNIIATIVKARKKQGLSQKELAEMLGTTQSVISRIENGLSKNITLDYLMKIICALGLSSKTVIKKAA